MYYIYFNKTRFPIVPEDIEMKINGANSTVTLINEGEINQIKSPKLTEISFDLLLPQLNKYPFASYPNGFHNASYYLEKFEKLFKNKSGFKFKITRSTPQGKLLFDTNMRVTIENYTIKESAKNGFDIVVSVTLKKYVPYGTKKVKVTNKVLTKKQIRKKNKKLPKKYTIKKGDTLYKIAYSFYGSGLKKYRTQIYKKNKKKIEKAAKKAGHKKGSANGKYLIKGTKIVVPKIKG